MLTKSDAVELLLDYPVELGRMYGFTKLTELHNRWIREMVIDSDDATLQSHRGSYKTTCVSIALAVIMVVAPNDKILFMRKTDDDTKEIVAQVKKILESKYFQACCMAIYGVELRLVVDKANELSTNLCALDARGSSQLFAIGMNGSLTGKHYDRIFTDDIVNIKDRFSKAEREATKRIYQELQNLKNRGGRIFNTGTPWHPEDAFILMPSPQVWDCYSTGLIDSDTLQEIRERMTSSLFSANYELRHIASDMVIFQNPNTDGDISMVEQGTCHIDASYGGEDYTAFTICRKHERTYYILGKLWQKHIDDVEDEIISIRKSLNAGRISCEDNGDKGYLARDLRNKGERTHIYHESMNKHLKITSYLKAVWKDVIFVAGTDEEYIKQVCDYTEEAEHDDAPDSLASIVREQWNKKDRDTSQGYGNLMLL